MARKDGWRTARSECTCSDCGRTIRPRERFYAIAGETACTGCTIGIPDRPRDPGKLLQGVV